jgi:putative heme-binding domain-containing protein
LNRLTNDRLLAVERTIEDTKYAPVYTALLTRAGMSRQHRDEALAALVDINKSDTITELIAAFDRLDADAKPAQRVARQLARVLVAQPIELLAAKSDLLTKAARSENRLLRPLGYAGLITAGKTDSAWELANEDAGAMLDFLAAVPLVTDAKRRAELRDLILVPLSLPGDAKRVVAAIEALAFVPNGQKENFRIVTALAVSKSLRTACVRTLLRIPKKHRDAEPAGELLSVLVKDAEATPAAQRTTDGFIDAMQLADELLALVPTSAARSYRERLRAVTVRVVRIQTVEEEMRYDTPYFAVEAGRPVQVVLQNEDLMPHNFVITSPGALQEVALAGQLSPQGTDGKPYVPDTGKVLFATAMVQSHQQTRLTFRAPEMPGEYPYVCTFPRHWMRMYGVMVVVKDLDAWLKNPKKPADPTGSNRSFVKSWQFDDLVGDLSDGLRGRTSEIGAKIFKEATCAQCHKVKGQGGAVGPELTDVFTRWKGSREDVLREIVDPSHKIDPKFAVHVIATANGQVVSGIVTSEDKDSISIVVNPEAPKPVTIPQDDIEEMVRSSKSMMPKALLDRFTKDEIFELLAYLESVNPPTPK